MISEIIGKTVTNINRTEDEMFFICADGTRYRMYHSQDCCENVNIEDIIGDLDDLVGVPILKASEDTNKNSDPENIDPTDKHPTLLAHLVAKKISNAAPRDDESFTWTFYNFATIKGYVTIRWFGSSNGYYSEGVDFEKF